MRADELFVCHGLLEEFVGEMFTPLARVDQRVKGGLYSRGLLLEGRRKSMQPMAGDGAQPGLPVLVYRQVIGASQ